MLAMTRGFLAALLLAASGAAAEEPLPAPARDARPAAGGPETAEGTEALADAPADASGASREARLDALFERLADPEAKDAEATLHGIAEIWSSSGSDSMDLLLRRGREAMNEESFEKALDHFDALTRLDPDFAEGWNARATLHFLREEYWVAMEDIRRALALEPRHFGAMSGLGVILERVGDEAGALRAFREAVRVNPHLDEAKEAVKRLAPKVDGRDI